MERPRGCGLRRIPARPLQTAFKIAHAPRRARRRRQGDGAARRALRQRPRRDARRRPRPPSGIGAPPIAATARPCSRWRCCAWRAVAAPANREEAAKLLAAAARLEHPLAAYNLGLLYLEGQLFPQDFARAAELFRVAAEAGSPEAQYALAILYKEGRGVQQGRRRIRAPALPRRRSPTTPTRRSSTPSRCSTATASPRAKKAPPASCCARRTGAVRSRRTGSPTCSPPAAACPPIRSRRSSGT